MLGEPPVPAPDPISVDKVTILPTRPGLTTFVPSAKPPPLTNMPLLMVPWISASVTWLSKALAFCGGVKFKSTIPLPVIRSVLAICPTLFSVDILAIKGSEL